MDAIERIRLNEPQILRPAQNNSDNASLPTYESAMRNQDVNVLELQLPSYESHESGTLPDYESLPGNDLQLARTPPPEYNRLNQDSNAS